MQDEIEIAWLTRPCRHLLACSPTCSHHTACSRAQCAIARTTRRAAGRSAQAGILQLTHLLPKNHRRHVARQRVFGRKRHFNKIGNETAVARDSCRWPQHPRGGERVYVCACECTSNRAHCSLHLSTLFLYAACMHATLSKHANVCALAAMLAARGWVLHTQALQQARHDSSLHGQ
jgi:hypothetical protein